MCGCSRPTVQRLQAPLSAGSSKRGTAALPGRIWPDAVAPARDQRRLARKVQRCLDRGLDPLGRQVQVAFGLVELLAKALQLLLKSPLEGQHPFDRLGLAFGVRRIERAARAPSMASSTCSAITGPTLPRSSRIAWTLFTARSRNSRSPSRSPGRVGRSQVLRVEAGRDEVVDLHLVGALAVAIDAAVALLQPVRVPGDLVVDQALSSGSGGRCPRMRHRWRAGCGRWPDPGSAWKRP